MSVSGKNSSMRSILRVAGPLLIFIGVVILIIAMVDFFSAFGSFGQPNKFYLFFLAIPFIFLGGIATSYGFMEPWQGTKPTSLRRWLKALLTIWPKEQRMVSRLSQDL